MSRQTLSTLLFTAAIVLAVLAAATILPGSPRYVLSDLGYHTFCPFAPWSTLALLGLAGTAWVVRNYIDAQPR